jgi:hypothetical protein
MIHKSNIYDQDSFVGKQSLERPESTSKKPKKPALNQLGATASQ